MCKIYYKLHVVVIDKKTKIKFDETKNTFYYAHATACAWSGNDG